MQREKEQKEKRAREEAEELRMEREKREREETERIRKIREEEVLYVLSCICVVYTYNMYVYIAIDCTRKWIGNAVQMFRHPPYGHVIKLRVCGARCSLPARDLSYRAVFLSLEVDESTLPSLLLVQCLSP